MLPTFKGGEKQVVWELLLQQNRMLQPEVRINQTVLYTQTSPLGNWQSNPVTGEESQQVLDGLAATARSAAENSGLIKEAEEQILDRLKEISQKNGQKIIFQ